MKVIKTNCYKGTRVLVGNTKRAMINLMADHLIALGFTEISMPIIQYAPTFYRKIGEQNSHMMFTFEDNAAMDLCLAPEYTAVIQSIQNDFPRQQDIKLFYVQECFRGERFQLGRYRQFTQFGIEILNPSKGYTDDLIKLAVHLCHLVTGYNATINDFEINKNVRRWLDYYLVGSGFEISCSKLGAQGQLVGGGEYDHGIGFAIEIDRLLLLTQEGMQEPGEDESTD